VEVWVSSDGRKTWKRFAVDEKLTGRVPFTMDKEGTYEFTTVAVDKVGNREKEPDGNTRPHFRNIVDLTAPRVTVTGPSDGSLAPAGGKVEYSWSVEDAYLVPKSVQMQAKFKKDKLWRTAARNLPVKGQRVFTLPRTNDGVVEVRFVAIDRAGNKGYGSAGGLKFDRIPPEGKVTGPQVASSLSVSVHYEVTDRGPSGLAEVKLWITSDNGRNWRELAKPPVGETSVRVPLPGPGTYGFYLSATDKAGNRIRPPSRRTRPQVVMLTDTDAPRMELLSKLEGRAFSARDVVIVKWKAVDQNLGPRPITVEFSADGGDTWTVVAKDLANTGSYTWKPSKGNSSRCLLRITARDVLGNATPVSTRLFTVDNKAPTSKATFEPAPEGDPGDGGAVKNPDPTRKDPGSSTAPTVSERDLLAEAEKLLRRGLRREAAEAAGKAITLNPRLGAAYLLRGRALLGVDDAAALKDLEVAERLVPGAEGLSADLGEAGFNLGKLSLEGGKVDEAKARLTRAAACFRKVQAKGRATPGKHRNLGLALLYLARSGGDPKVTRAQADAEFEKCRKLAGRDRKTAAECYWWQATLKEDAGDYRAAARLWNKAARTYGTRTALGKRALERAGQTGRRRRRR